MSAKFKKIRELNDAFRTTMTGGRIVMTPGIAALDVVKRMALQNAVQRFDKFDEDNDPHHEHDFGSILFDGEKIFWKIDYFDKSLEYGSEDPSDPAQTTRVMTIMLASEY